MIKAIQEEEQKGERRRKRERNRKVVIAHMRKQKHQLIGELAQVVITHRATGFFIQA